MKTILLIISCLLAVAGADETASLQVNKTTGAIQVQPPPHGFTLPQFRSANGIGTSSFSGAFTDLTGKPTTLAGYGITNGQPLSSILSALANNTVTTVSDGNISITFNSVSGNGSGLTSLNADQITTGTVDDARLSGNIPLLNFHNHFTTFNTFDGQIIGNNSIYLTTLGGNTVGFQIQPGAGQASDIEQIYNVGGFANVYAIDATGNVLMGGDTTTTALRFLEASGNGVEYIGLRGPNAVGFSFDFILPPTDGNPGQYLKTDSFHQLGWATPITSIQLSVPSFLTVTGSPMTANGTFAITYNSGNPLPAIHGGTGQSAFTLGDILYADSATTIGRLGSAVTGNVLASQGVGAAPSWINNPTLFGDNITQLNGSNISTGTVANARTTAVSTNTASTLVLRDGSGNFAANTITANLTGNATTVTTIPTLSGDVANTGNATTIPHSVTFTVNGAGSAVTTGVSIPVKTKYGGTLIGYTMMCSPSGSLTFNVFRAANSAGLPTASIVNNAGGGSGTGTLPAIASGVEGSSTTFTNWGSTTITANDNLALNLTTVDGVVTQCTFVLYFR